MPCHRLVWQAGMNRTQEEGTFRAAFNADRYTTQYCLGHGGSVLVTAASVAAVTRRPCRQSHDVTLHVPAAQVTSAPTMCLARVAPGDAENDQKWSRTRDR